MPTTEQIPVINATRNAWPIERRLIATWHRERRFYHVRAMARLIPWIIGVFLVDLLLDWFVELPGWARILLVAANSALLIWILFRDWWRYLSHYNATHVALKVERLHPELNNLLVSYVQFQETPTNHPHGSQRMIEVVRYQAGEAVATLNFAGIVSFRTLRRIFTVSATVLLLFVASSVFAGEYYAALIKRLINPFSNHKYPTRTNLVDPTGDIVVRQGDSVALSVGASGEIPQSASLVVVPDRGAKETAPLALGKDNVFHHEIDKASSSFGYRFHVGDAASDSYRVTVVPAPRIMSIRMNVTFPEYTGLPAKEYDRMQIPNVLEGSKIVWELTLDQPLADSKMRLRDDKDRTIDCVVDASDSRKVRLVVPNANVLLAPTQPGRTRSDGFSYSFRWVEKAHGFTFDDPTTYVIRLNADRPPTIAVRKPQMRSDSDRLVGTLSKRLELNFKAMDDFGVARARLIYRVNDGDEKSFEFKGTIAPASRSVEFDVYWPVAEHVKGIKVGDVVTCIVEVDDNRTHRANPKEGRCRSDPIRLQIVNDEDYRIFVEKEKSSGLDRARAAAREESESAGKTKLLIKD